VCLRILAPDQEGERGEVMTGEAPHPDSDLLAEFAAFREKFLDHLLDGIPDDEKDLWRDLR
jgi:hypothetical protein